MSVQKLPYFSEAFDLEALDLYYDTEFTLAGRTIAIDLNFDDNVCSEELFDTLRKFLNKLQEVITLGRRSIRQEFASGTVVAEYMQLHLDELEPEEIEELTKNAHASQSIEEQLISALMITRIGFYPNDDEHFAVLDFSFGEEISNYLLAVNFNAEMVFESVVMES